MLYSFIAFKMFIITRSVNLLKVHDGLSPNCKCFFFSVSSFGLQVTQTTNTTDLHLQMLLRLKCSLWWASCWVSWCPGSYRGWCKQDTVKILPIKLGCSGNRTSANAEMWLLLCKRVQILKNSGSKQTDGFIWSEPNPQRQKATGTDVGWKPSPRCRSRSGIGHITWCEAHKDIPEYHLVERGAWTLPMEDSIHVKKSCDTFKTQTACCLYGVAVQLILHNFSVWLTLNHDNCCLVVTPCCIVKNENDPPESSPEVHHETKRWQNVNGTKTVCRQDPFIYITDTLDFR